MKELPNALLESTTTICSQLLTICDKSLG